MKNTIQHGNCLDVLKAIPDSSVDSIVTDVPYVLGGRSPTVDELVGYLQGKSVSFGEFMGKDWDAPSVPVWGECFRVLKPGGFLLSFAGTRTMDLISMGIRAAGFDNRDCIDAEMGPPVLRWLRAQGMPKSVDIAKSIDKKLGKADNALDLVKEWQGYGTALKPYWEPILVFRKPVEEKTLVEQILKTGTGGLNIDGCRIRHSSPEDLEQHKVGVDAIRARGGVMKNSWKNSSDLAGANEVSVAGRFPPNALFVHSDLCRKVGHQKVPMPPINRFDDGAKPFGGGSGHSYTTFKREDEEIPIWECHHSCPVLWLEKQAQGASRYFFGVDPDSLFFYVPKPNRGEKDFGLGEGEENVHATVKPIRLMQYLVRLVTRKGGLVLDPYCGSGTTCIAAVLEGFDFIGIEKEESSVLTARARVKGVLQDRCEKAVQDEAYALTMTLSEEV